jgi:hypothetical protein
VQPPIGPVDPLPPPANPPADPPKNDKDCHDHSCWHPWFGVDFGYNNYNSGWCNNGGYCEYPVVVEQPVYVQQPVVVEQAAVTIEAASLTKVPVGATITLHGKDFGMENGRVGVATGDLMLAAAVTNWSNEAVTLTVPQLALAAPAKAKFVVFRADGSVASEVPCELVLGSMMK